MMHHSYRYTLTTLLCCLAPAALCASERMLLDEGWRFQQGDVAGAEAKHFDDSGWRRVDLPHDWSTATAPTAGAPSGGHGGYHHMGVGWYRRTLQIPASESGCRYRLEFDSAYHNAEVWLDGRRLVSHAYGYTPFSFEISHDVRQSKTYELAVRIDNSDQPNCRWYSGSGLYRHVWFRKLPRIHIEPSTVWTTTTHVGETSRFELRMQVVNTTREPQAVSIESVVQATDSHGELVKTTKVTLEPQTKRDMIQEFELDSTPPWSPEDPRLEHLTLRLRRTDEDESDEPDSLEHSFGLRTIAIDGEQGFLLNGEPLLLLGGNVHHDHGPLGAASFDMAEQRKVKLLKAAGFNAVRTSHNPPSEAFLDACDRHGLLVIDEAFDGWAKSKVEHDYGREFDDLWREVVTSMVERDRRHPSVVMWSIGNEVYERGEPSGQRIAAQLSDCVRELDPSRPVTIGLNGLGEEEWAGLDPVFKSVDVCGYNYEMDRYRADHQRHPRRIMYASESYSTQAFESWHAVSSQDYVIGDFVWSAMDYLGEAGIGRVFPPGLEPRRHWEGEHFPWRAAACGDIDLIGQRKPISHYRNIVWNRGEKLFLAVEQPAPDGGDWQLTPWATPPCRASWTWNVAEGTPMTVHAYSRFPKVRLMLNDRLIGEGVTTEANQYHATFTVPFNPGVLRLEGLTNEATREQMELRTAGEATNIALSASHDSVVASRQRIVFVDVSLVDRQQQVQTQSDRELRFAIRGPAEIIAVGNASPTSRLAYTESQWPTSEGRLLVVLRSTGEPGTATLVAEAEGLPKNQMNIKFHNK